MYRVCLSCDAVKECFVCAKKQTKEYFGVTAWRANKPTRRVCLQCQTKSRGSWKCASCHKRQPQLQFSNFVAQRPSGQDGTQICNTCQTEITQTALRKRAVKTSLARLEPLRKRVRRADILRDTWEAIARKRNAETLLRTETQMNIVTAPAGQSAATAREQDGQSRTDTDAPCHNCGDERAKRKQRDRVLADSKA